MKLTTSQLRQLIHEEINTLNENVELADLPIPKFISGKPAAEVYAERGAQVILAKDNPGLFDMNTSYHTWKNPMTVKNQDGETVEGKISDQYQSKGAIILIPEG